jgi:hypothetical protein
VSLFSSSVCLTSFWQLAPIHGKFCQKRNGFVATKKTKNFLFIDREHLKKKYQQLA